MFLAALAIFTLASALCGLAQTFGELVGARILQGAGGGMLTPTGMAMLYRTFPPAERVRASRILTVPTALAPALAAFATITPAATGAAWTLFNTGRQLGMAAGVAILTTVASAVGLTKHVAAGTAPHLAAYHAGLVTASVIALIAAGVARFVDDRAAAATMRRPESTHRGAAAAAYAVSAGCHHPAATYRVPASAQRVSPDPSRRAAVRPGRGGLLSGRGSPNPDRVWLRDCGRPARPSAAGQVRRGRWPRPGRWS